ncbi:tyrosine-type recombinase/integrase [Endozoicomonas lisbonensis]|uniref:Integrase n=1 Tax=Endozoicomonas lisbonensis TaxID=3120522 RepID=A0ABV2SL74_9GAMM
MALYHIEKRTKKNGDTRYRCMVRVKKNGQIIHQESKTFSKKSQAKAYGKKRVNELEDTDYLKKVQHRKHFPQQGTVASLIQRYIDELYPVKPWGRSKQYSLDLLLNSDLAKKDIYSLKASDIIDHCQLRQKGGTGPATVSQDISYLRSVLSLAKPSWNIEVTAACIDEATPFLRKHGLIAHSKARSRRPNEKELYDIRAALEKRQLKPQSTIPLVDIFEFSIFSCMRVGEVCRILWEDIDYIKKTVVIRDRKDPRHKAGNDQTVALLGPAWDIVIKQAKTDCRIFPHNSNSVSAAFQRCRNKLNIHDLRYHDLRREGASRLFELGYKIEEVASVTGHRDLSTLWKIYTAIDTDSLHRRYEELKNKK